MVDRDSGYPRKTLQLEKWDCKVINGVAKVTHIYTGRFLESDIDISETGDMDISGTIHRLKRELEDLLTDGNRT